MNRSILKILKLKFVRHSLKHVDHLFSRQKKLNDPPLFIVGAPRSGTTLLYQLLTKNYYFSFIRNIANLYPQIPYIISKFIENVDENTEDTLKSNYGYISGLKSPSEGGMIWNKYFPNEYEHGYNYVDAGFVDEKNQKKITKLISGIESISNYPFISKNVKHSVRIKALKYIFPNAIFIHIKRNPIDVCSSIYFMRMDNSKDINQWYGVMPKEIDKIKNLTMVEQIVNQVYFLRQNIVNDFKEIGNCRCLTLNYEDLCKNPQKSLLMIEEFLKTSGLILKRKHSVKKIPKLKTNSKKDLIPPQVAFELTKQIKKIFRE